MKRKFFLPVIALIALSFMWLFLLKEKDNKKQEAYAEFLKSKYKEISGIDASKADSIPKFDRPDIAALQDYFMTLDPNTGRIPRERLYKAYQQTKSLQESLKNDPIQWSNIPVEMGGRTRAIMFDPNDADHSKVFAGSVTGGLWYNDDIFSETSSWSPVNDFWDNLTVSSLTYDPNNTQVMYAGTGEPETAVIVYRESSGRGIGIWKSTDGGETWSLIPSTEDFAYITDVVVKDESGQSVVYAAVVSGTYMGSQHQSQPTDGLYRSTDGGDNWQQVLPDIPGTDVPYTPSDIEIGADGRIYIGTKNNLDGEGGAVILYSDDGTQGTWTVNDTYRNIILNDPDFNIPGRVMIAAAPSDANRVYALVASGYTSSNNGFNYYYCNYILRSDNKGVSWTEKSQPTDLSSGSNFATLAWHALIGRVNPTNPDELFVGGLDVFKTTDGGNSWLPRLSDWYGMYYGGGDRYVHADIHEMAFQPGNDNNLLIVTDGGVFYTGNSTNNAPVFEERNHNYNTLQFYTCDIAPPEDQDLLVGGLQDNGTLFYQGIPITINDMIDGGDGAYCFFDNDDVSGVMITSTYYNSYTFFYNSGNNSNYYSGDNGTFVSPADYDHELNTLYANAMEFGGSYQDYILRISGIPQSPNGQNVNVNTGATTPFSHVKVSPHSPTGTTNLYLGTQAGRLFKLTNAESSPASTELTGANFPAGNISSVDIGGTEDTILVTFSNYGVTSIWQSYDGGSSWESKEGALPDMPIRWALYKPGNAKIAMIATEIGVWYADNLDETDVTWIPATDGLANVRVDMLRLRETDNTVLAATHGRGLFTAQFGAPPALSADFVASTRDILEGESINFTDQSVGSPNSWEWTFEGAEPASSNLQNPSGITYQTQGTYNVTLTVSNDNGSNTVVKEDYISVSPDGVATINESDFTVYPNPSNGIFKINIPEHSRCKNIAVYSAEGKEIFSKKINGTGNIEKVDVSKAPKGVYFVKIYTTTKVITKKIYKNS